MFYKKTLMAFTILAFGIQSIHAKPPRQGEMQCYSRTYSSIHLSNHPLQKVKDIYIRVMHNISKKNHFMVDIFVERPWNDFQLENNLTCRFSRAKDADIECDNGMSRDYGSVTMKWDNSKNQLIIYNKRGFTLIDPTDTGDEYNPDEYVTFEAKPKADDVFRLDRKSCTSGDFEHLWYRSLHTYD